MIVRVDQIDYRLSQQVVLALRAKQADSGRIGKNEFAFGMDRNGFWRPLDQRPVALLAVSDLGRSELALGDVGNESGKVPDGAALQRRESHFHRELAAVLAHRGPLGTPIQNVL